MSKKKSESSPREKQIRANALFMTPLSERERKELEGLAKMADSKIDFSDAPEIMSVPASVRVGRFYRPIKQQISLRVDADVLAWFRSRGNKYQKQINEVLRREMQSGLKRC